MASASLVLLCGIAALLFWAVIGFPIARKFLPHKVALPAAPALGWAVHSVLALPLYRAVGFTAGAVTTCSVTAAAIALFFLARPSAAASRSSDVSPWAYALAIPLSIVPALAVLPKISAGAVTLSPAIFDHSKVALVDQMSRLGLPPANPFFGEAGPFAYYYLWHFSAAEMAVVFAISGWEADAALTGVTAFASLSLLIGLATWIGGRTAGLWVAPFAFAGSLRSVLESAFGTQAFETMLQRQSGLAGWLFQTAWAPQHVASATCILIALLLIVRLAAKPDAGTATVLGLISAAGYQSSLWVGGFLFGAAAPIVGIILLGRHDEHRREFIFAAIFATALALLLSYPFLHDQIANAAARGNGSAIAFNHYEVFGDLIPSHLRRLLDFPAYWLIFLFVEFPAIYIPGFAMLIATLRHPSRDTAIADSAIGFFVVAAFGVLTPAYLTVTLSDNNDLGWRAALPAIMILTVFTAVGLARWMAQLARPAIAATLGILALSLPKSFELTNEYWRGIRTGSDQAFSQTPQLWAAVRRHSAPDERVAINPFFMEKMTPWSINISWALLSNRASCFAGRDYMVPFTTLSPAAIDDVAARFQRVFGGSASAADIDILVFTYRCRVVVFTPQDEAWGRDQFPQGGLFSLVENRPGWKIYRAKN